MPTMRIGAITRNVGMKYDILRNEDYKTIALT